MKTLNGIKNKLKDYKAVLKEKYNLKEISIFGSYTRNDQTIDSDIDILVSFSKPIGLIKFIQLEGRLEQILKSKVDLVPKKGIKIELKDSILKEAVAV